MCIANGGSAWVGGVADARVRSRRSHPEMDLLVKLLAVSLCGGIRAQANHETLKERGFRSIYSFEDGFEPFAFAAVPLHQPMPIIRIVSPSPAHKYKFGAPYEAEVEPTRNHLAHQPLYSASTLESMVTEPLESSETERQTAEVIYARPNKRGGYTYRKPARPRRPTPDPIIIRVHKYKVVRDR